MSSSSGTGEARIREDEYWMAMALQYASRAGAMDEVPVGAVLIDDAGELLAGAGNNCIAAADPAGHAEIRALRMAAQHVENYRLPATTMYVTLEPCAMCAAAMIQARVARIVFGTADSKAGALQSVYRIGSDGRLNHVFMVTAGVMASECSLILKEFFKQRR